MQGVRLLLARFEAWLRTASEAEITAKEAEFKAYLANAVASRAPGKLIWMARKGLRMIAAERARRLFTGE